MKAKWLIGILIVGLTILGVSKNQLTTPNQQIILQFNHTDVTEVETQEAIAKVREQLQIAGVDNIQLRHKEHGKLVFAYYSKTDIDHVKEILSNYGNVVLGVTNDPQNKPTDPSNPQKDYSLDVYEINSSNDLDLDSKGDVAVFKLDTDRFVQSSVYCHHNLHNLKDRFKCGKSTVRIFNYIALAKNHTSHQIPEVRAGPYRS